MIAEYAADDLSLRLESWSFGAIGCGTGACVVTETVVGGRPARVATYAGTLPAPFTHRLDYFVPLQGASPGVTRGLRITMNCQNETACAEGRRTVETLRFD